MMSESEKKISSATVQNWKRLHTSADGRLTRRANKRESKKKILPLEYLVHKENIALIQEILKIIYSENWKPAEIMFSLCVNLLKANGILDCDHVQKTLEPYRAVEIRQPLLDIPLPTDEYDLLGMIYQCILLEGEKNAIGAYYTPRDIAANMTKELSFANGQILLDPCCGSGSFLLACDSADPSRLFGADSDPVAVMTAKVNLLIKYKTRIFTPNIDLSNYLENININIQQDYSYKYKLYDYIVTNPPWGAVSDKNQSPPEITSGETFSCFFVRAFHQLKSGGVIRFLLPESVLNVKTHRDIRAFMLSHGVIESITRYDERFTGVTTKYIDISFKKQNYQNPRSSVILISSHGNREIDIASFYRTKNLIFNLLDTRDTRILDKVEQKRIYTLQDSVWALGIVTGDNKNKLSAQPRHDMEPIYTGKEISPYILKSPKNYILYDRRQFQQAAKDEIYRAPEKLIYKFICDKLIFAYDNAGRLFLNSANILIPNIPGMSIKTVLAFLNSPLYQFLYLRLFGEVKILKGNLIELPFPAIDSDTDQLIYNLVDLYLASKDYNFIRRIQDYIYYIFSVTDEEKLYITSVIET